jgi:hypothetical protein
VRGICFSCVLAGRGTPASQFDTQRLPPKKWGDGGRTQSRRFSLYRRLCCFGPFCVTITSRKNRSAVRSDCLTESFFWEPWLVLKTGSPWVRWSKSGSLAIFTAHPPGLVFGDELGRRRIKSVSSRSIVFRQPRLRTLLPNETTLMPCVAAKPALAHLRPCALTLGTLQRGGDTDPTLTGRNASPTIATTRKRHRCSFLVAKLTTMRRSVRMEVSKLKEAAN